MDEGTSLLIGTEFVRSWFTTYLCIYADRPGLHIYRKIKLKKNHRERYKQFLDAYIFVHDDATRFTLGEARQFANYLENQYMIHLEDGTKANPNHGWS